MARFIAMRGFSANGIDCDEGEDVTDKFDAQTARVLTAMGRLAERDMPDLPPIEGTNRAVKGTKADAKAPAVDLPPGLPPAS